jgi:hypothetical protein
LSQYRFLDEYTISKLQYICTMLFYFNFPNLSLTISLTAFCNKQAKIRTRFFYIDFTTKKIPLALYKRKTVAFCLAVCYPDFPRLSYLPFLLTRKSRGKFSRPGKTRFRFRNKGCAIVRIWEQRTCFIICFL